MEFEIRNSNLVYALRLIQHSISIHYLQHYASLPLERLLEKFGGRLFLPPLFGGLPSSAALLLLKLGQLDCDGCVVVVIGENPFLADDAVLVWNVLLNEFHRLDLLSLLDSESFLFGEDLQFESPVCDIFLGLGLHNQIVL